MYSYVDAPCPPNILPAQIVGDIHIAQTTIASAKNSITNPNDPAIGPLSQVSSDLAVIEQAASRGIALATSSGIANDGGALVNWEQVS